MHSNELYIIYIYVSYGACLGAVMGRVSSVSNTVGTVITQSSEGGMGGRSRVSSYVKNVLGRRSVVPSSPPEGRRGGRGVRHSYHFPPPGEVGRRRKTNTGTGTRVGRQ